MCQASTRCRSVLASHVVALDFCLSSEHSIVMRKRMVRVLLTTISCMLALPAGWCCRVNAIEPNRSSSSSESSYAPPPPTPSHNHEGCPRCQRVKAPVPVESPQPVPEPTKPPAEPRCGTCCERDLAAPPSSDVMDFLTVAPVGFQPVLPPEVRVSNVPVARFYTATGPPLHIRLCVWLC